MISGSPAQCPDVDLMVFVRTDNVGVAWQEFDCEGGFLRIEFKCWKIRIPLSGVDAHDLVYTQVQTYMQHQ